MVSRCASWGDGTKGAVCGNAKLRGDFSCEKPPLLSDFSKTWFGFQVTADVTPKLFGTYGQARVSRTPSFLRCKSFLVPSRRSRFPDCCVRLVSDSLASLFFVPLRGLVSDSLAGFFSCPSPKVSTPVPLRVPLPLLREFLVQSPCGFRFRRSDGSCPLSPAGGFLLR
jgi:hypothetical protein